MLRKQVQARTPDRKGFFRNRGEEVSRIEGFSDAVFAFAVTLLVVSLEVPETFSELLDAMRNFGAFAICFLLLILIWSSHYTFFRRYGLQDQTTLNLNAILLFVVLFYVYPLKFLFTLLIKQLMNIPLDVELPNGSTVPIIAGEQNVALMVIYGIGFVAVFAVFALLYIHAYRQRVALDLDTPETFATQHGIINNLLQAGVGLVSILVVVLGGRNAVGLAGYAYFLLVPVRTIGGYLMGRRIRQAVAAARS